MSDARPLQSFSEGRWQDGSGEAEALLDATTGDVVAWLHEVGPDPDSLLTYARTVGGPALRALTFKERAEVLKALAKHLSAQIPELVALSTRTGATRRDSAVDVDGGIGTVAVYASKAARELPDSIVLPDGATEPLGKGGTFAGRHLYSSKLGAAVQINAFNFPVWGMLEKLAPAFLAGMPSVVKPAPQTAYLTELAVRMIIESEILPPGSLSLLCAGPAGLVDQLGPQDTLGFTGSAATATLLRTHPVVAGRSVAFNAEADSLNCSILGPDVAAGDPELTLFVDQLVTEMTVKAGQKCTAIRRAFVPAWLIADVRDAVCDRLAAIVVGDPALSETEMGPVVSLAQRREVRAAVAELSATARLVFGDPAKVAVSGADGEQGAFLSPILLQADDIGAEAVHRIEAFGPVSTLLPYHDLDQVVAAAGSGGGSLVGSIVTHSPDVARRLIDGLAPWHGRLLMLDRDDAAESTGHGVAIPQMLHGGPGRAGGGQELGGLRSLTHYLQRTAIQGHPLLLDALAD